MTNNPKSSKYLIEIGDSKKKKKCFKQFPGDQKDYCKSAVLAYNQDKNAFKHEKKNKQHRTDICTTGGLLNKLNFFFLSKQYNP